MPPGELIFQLGFHQDLFRGLPRNYAVLGDNRDHATMWSPIDYVAEVPIPGGSGKRIFVVTESGPIEVELDSGQWNTAVAIKTALEEACLPLGIAIGFYDALYLFCYWHESVWDDLSHTFIERGATAQAVADMWTRFHQIYNARIR